jgi:hypothetical protein
MSICFLGGLDLMKRILIMAAAIACTSLVSTSAQAGYVTLTTTLDALAGTGNSFVEGPLTFGSFTDSGSTITSPVYVSAIDGPTEYGFTLTGNFASYNPSGPPYTSEDLPLTYVVSSSGGPITDATLSAVGSGSYWSVTEYLWSGTNAGGTYLGELMVSSTSTAPAYLSGFSATSIFIEKDINVLGVPYSTISFVNQSFSVVPEPASMGLLGIGLTGLLAYRRRFKKASV